jgi:TrmH family RNA methyltransferase
MKFEDIKRLHEKKFREKLGHFIVEGEHLVQELEKAAARDARLRESKIFMTRDYSNWSSALPMNIVQSKHMAQISETRSPQGIVAVVPLLEAPAPREGERAIYLHEIQDPGNFGTILRTLAWFGNFRCLCSPDSVDLHNGKVVRASMGAIFHVPVEFDVSLDSLAKRFTRIAALDLNGRSVSSPAFREFDCYVFGNEARGLPREQMNALGAQSFTIAGTGAIESLNVAAAVNMSLYEINRAGVLPRGDR